MSKHTVPAAGGAMPAEADPELIEPFSNASVMFTGVKTQVVNGVAHLLFYVAQPQPTGALEHIVVARMVAPFFDAKAAIEAAAVKMRLPVSRPVLVLEDATLH